MLSSILSMDNVGYFSKIPSILGILIFTVAFQLIDTVMHYKEHRDSGINWGDLIKLLLLAVLNNSCIAYLIGAISFVDFTISDKPTVPYYIIWIVAFLIISGILGAIYIYVTRKRQIKKNPEVAISLSTDDYRSMINLAEKSAKKIRILPKRENVVFKSDEFVKYIASIRHGVGSDSYNNYINEHETRKNTFYLALNKGTFIQELHNKDDLKNYIRTGSHEGLGNQEISEKDYLRNMLEAWITAISNYPNNYYVRLTDIRIPIKYEVIDDNKFIIHEAIGGNSNNRFNAIMIDNKEAANRIVADFNNLWEGASVRECSEVIEWINRELFPLLTDD